MLSYKFRSYVIVVGTTPIPLTPFRLETKNGLLIKRMGVEAGIVFLGGSDVTIANGYPLDNGDEVYIPLDECSKINIVANQMGRTLRILCL